MIKDDSNFGIITFHSVHNYGAMLQAYALQEVCKKAKINVEIIDYKEKKSNNMKNTIFSKLKYLKSINFNIHSHFNIVKEKKITKDKFNKFHQKYLNISHEKYYTLEDLQYANNIYDGFICGSDMIWTDIGQNMAAYFLTFADSGKRISYAPSLTGTKQLNNVQKERINKMLSRIDYLSCREQEGIDYIKNNLKKNPTLTLDPTLLLSKKEWCDILQIKDINKNKKKYILCYMFGGVPPKVLKQIKKIALKENMIIRFIPMNTYEYNYEKRNGFTASYGPKEFVELFFNAEFIVTNSFHGLIFSIISEKPYIVYHREKNNRWSINEERMANLLNIVEENERYLNLSDNIESYFSKNDKKKNISKKIEKEKNISLNYLKNAINCVKNNNKKNNENREIISNNICDRNNRCCGCEACISSCPFKAIELKKYEDGFLYPIINKKKCKKCMKCTKVCQMFNKIKLFEPKKKYVGFSKLSKRINSASGGIFYTIAKCLIEEQGAIVYGSVLTNNLICKHIRIDNVLDLEKIQNSKYVQSQINKNFINVKNDLIAKKTVVFSGTPCQIQGLKLFLGIEYDNLLTIDLLCHGVPSPYLFKKYVNNLSNKKINSLVFRNKQDNSKSKYEIKYNINGKKYKIKAYKDIYYKLFMNGKSLRKSCYYCKFATRKRIGDISLGDCDSEINRSSFYPYEVKSTILLNTDKGINLFNKCKNNINYTTLDFDEECETNKALSEIVEMPIERHDIFKDLEKMPWNKFVKKYYSSKK